MQRNKLQKLQTYLRTLKLFKVKESDNLKMLLPKSNDKTRFSIRNWIFECGMPACVAGHAGYIFDWDNEGLSWSDTFEELFDLSGEEMEWIVDIGSYKILNPSPETAAKHIQDVLDGKFKGD